MFEPLEIDESAGDGDDVAPQTLAQPEDNNPFPPNRARRFRTRRRLVTTINAAGYSAAIFS